MYELWRSSTYSALCVFKDSLDSLEAHCSYVATSLLLQRKNPIVGIRFLLLLLLVYALLGKSSLTVLKTPDVVLRSGSENSLCYIRII